MPDHDKTLHSVRDIAEALGGAGAMAELLGVGPTAVLNWLNYGVIPPKWYFPLADALAASGLEADRGLFREHPRAARTANAG